MNTDMNKIDQLWKKIRRDGGDKEQLEELQKL